jgi:hypothetical protein
MTAKLGPFGKIVEDFTESVRQIFGGSTKSNSKGEASKNDTRDRPLFSADLGGSPGLVASNWIGNAGTDKNKVKYGFAILNASKVAQSQLPESNIYYLDIPPQAITQKENFASNITATRKGVLVESEGVIFKDIVIQGTTGIMPSPRGSSSAPQAAALKDFAKKGPTAPHGVKAEDGKSTNSTSTAISGYEEFMRLRQFFLRYAREKVDSDGDRFLVFINQKDNQAIIVEPLEFVMERNSKSPMTYNYRIVMKGIGTLDKVLADGTKDKNLAGKDPASLLTKIANVSANSAAAIKQARAVIGASNQLLQRTSQAIDQTFLGPLRQAQFALEDLAEGKTTALSLPAILARNATDIVLNVREVFDGGNVSVAELEPKTSNGLIQISPTSQPDKLDSTQFVLVKEISLRIQSDSRVPVPRSFIQNLVKETRTLEENLTDGLNLGSDAYNEIVRRSSTAQPNPLKTASDEELLLLGSLQTVQVALNSILATNGMFQSDAQTAFQSAAAPFEGTITLNAPASVREVKIQQGEILERIAQREYGDASRWVDIVVLNNLKPPYIGTVRQDGVKIPGDKILIGNI